MPDTLLTPASEDELAEIVRDHAARSAPLAIRGGGTRPVGAPVPGTPLSTRAIEGISLYEPGALTLVVRAGTPIEVVEKTLAEHNQRLAFEPTDHRPLLGTTGTPTIGGIVAANVSGPRRIADGACRDTLLGVRFVNGKGEIIKSGGRVMKNVTGYDLSRLMAGARGTLGILTEVAFKVLPLPEGEATLLARSLDYHEAVAAMARALGSPWQVTSAAHLPAELAGGASETRLRLEGWRSSVESRAEKLVRHLGGEWELIRGEESASMWREVRDVLPFVGHEGAVWRISLKPTDAPAFLELIAAAGLEHHALLDWGGGLVWLITPDEGDAGAARIRGELASLGGHATLVRASEETQRCVSVFHPEAPRLAALARGLKTKFDPADILNRGLMDPAMNPAPAHVTERA